MGPSENTRLEQIASDSWYAKGVNATSVHYSAKLFSRHWRGTSCLEMGPAEGLMTRTILTHFRRVVLVEGSELFAAALALEFPTATVVHSLFEEFDTDERFDTIVLGHVLEHVEDPSALLKSLRGLLTPDGVVCAAVPNARSLHRQAAVIMGLLETESSLNDTDAHHGHRRVYDPESFRNQFSAAGFRIEIFGGYWIKPLSNAQLDATWSAEMIDAFFQLGERYPDIAAEIYIVATNAPSSRSVKTAGRRS